MLDRDFFGFCTTLKPLELKTIGALSRVVHLDAGEDVYQPGDPSDEIYIVNRGVVEVLQPGREKFADAYLSRGNIFGDVEVMTELPRKHLVRTREPVSLQCFHRKEFPELIRRVPSFFQYLSEQLAFRLLRATDLAVAQTHSLELQFGKSLEARQLMHQCRDAYQKAFRANGKLKPGIAKTFKRAG